MSTIENNSNPKNGFHPELDRLLIFLIDFGFDALMQAAIFAVFLLFAWVIGRSQASGWGTAEHFKAYEDAHFYLNVALFGTVGLALFLRVCKALWKHKSDFRQVFGERRTKFTSFFYKFGSDTLIGLIVFAVFLLFARGFELARAYDLGNEQNFKTYELIHFWVTYASFVAVGFAFLLGMWKALLDELT